MRRFAILISLVGIVWVAGGAAQSPNPFGIPSADQPTPAAAIDAVAGSRAQGWLAQGRSEVLARHGIVATSDPLAAQAGVEILRQGGNAIDAAVAAGAVLDVTSQNDTGIGGDLFALVWSARDKKLYALNSGGWAPAAWTPQFFTEKLGVKTVPGAGVNSATVPGAISGYDALLKRFGTMTFEQTFDRAARIAEEGWGQAERRHADLRSAVKGLLADPDSRQTFLAGDRAPDLYSLIRNPALAKALRLEGEDATARELAVDLGDDDAKRWMVHTDRGDLLKARFVVIGPALAENLDRLYTEDVHFRDPISEVTGLPELQRYFTRFAEVSAGARFEITDEVVQPGQAAVFWTMVMVQRDGSDGRRFQGVSHMKVRDRIYEERDYFDLGEAVYDHVPVVGWLTRFVRSRID